MARSKSDRSTSEGVSISRCRRKTWLFCPSTRPETWACSGQNFAKRNFGGGGSRGRLRPVLSGVEGNLQSKRPSLCDSIVLFGSRACERRTKLNAPQSRRARRAAAQPSNWSLCLDCVRSIDDRDRPMSPRNKSHRSISRCKRRTWLFCPSTRPERWARSGQNFAFAKFWRRGELNPRPKSLATRRLHACPVPIVSPGELRAGKTRSRLVR